jgi:hemoglobin
MSAPECRKGGGTVRDNACVTADAEGAKEPARGDQRAALYERVGADTFYDLVAQFYARVAVDPVLRPLYPDDDFRAAGERLALFLIQYWGGPSTYSDTRGHPRLRMRHVPFHIGPAARDRWIELMMAAVDGLSLEPEDDAELRSYLVTAAMSLQNQAED